MTRFNITIQEGVDLVIKTLKNAIGGEIIIPKLKSFKIIDLAKALNDKNNHKIIGIRSGEKLHEQMITKSDSHDTLETKNSYIILPPKILDEENYLNVLKYYKKKFKAKKVKVGFEYSSDQNGKFLSIKEIKKIFPHKNLKIYNLNILMKKINRNKGILFWILAYLVQEKRLSQKKFFQQ